jgi:hypothetical protein
LKRQHLLTVIALAAVGVLAWDLLRPEAAPESGKAAAQIAAPPAPARAAHAVSIPAGPGDVGRSSNFLRPASVSTATVSPLAREFSNSLAWKPIHDRLRATGEGQTPEGQYYLYRMLKACATLADRKGAAPRSPNTAQLEERRQQIAASLPEGDPRRAQRLEAFEKAAADQCAGFAGITTTEAELSQLLRNALAAGDPKARAWQVEQDMWQERRSANTPGRAGATLSEPQVSSLREAFASRDPEAIAIAGRVLSNSFRDLTVRIGPDQEPIESRVFMNAALLLACEYGYACGDNNPRVLNACAFQGHCGVSSLPDYLFYYGSSPYDAQLLDRYRTILRNAVDTGDWSSLVIDRSGRSPSAYGLPLGMGR